MAPTPTVENAKRCRACGHPADAEAITRAMSHPPKPTKPLRIFLSGPISSCGGPAVNVPRFAARAAELRARGFHVENPCENFGGRMDLERPTYLRASTAQLLTCDRIAFLEGWEDSPGALWEARVAEECGIPCFA